MTISLIVQVSHTSPFLCSDFFLFTPKHLFWLVTSGFYICCMGVFVTVSDTWVICVRFPFCVHLYGYRTSLLFIDHYKKKINQNYIAYEYNAAYSSAIWAHANSGHTIIGVSWTWRFFLAPIIYAYYDACLL